MEALQTSFVSAIGEVSTNVMAMVTAALPVALGIVGTFLAVRLSIKFFKSVTGRA